MVLNELLTLLQEDSQLSAILKPTIRDKKIYMFDTSQNGNVLTYTYTSLISNKVIEQSRFEVNAISMDCSTALQMAEHIKRILLTLGDEPLTDNILEVTQNGGGMLKDSEKGSFKVKVIFTIKSKVRRA